MIKKISINNTNNKAFLLLAILILFNKPVKCQPAQKEGFAPFANIGVFGMSVNWEYIAQNYEYDCPSNIVLRQFPLILVPVPFFNGGCKYSASKGIFSFKNTADASLSLAGIGTSFTSSVSITPLFSLFARAHVETAWNYGSAYTLIGLYNPEEATYESVTPFAEFSYGMAFGANVLVPITKTNIIKLSYCTDYIAFSAAEDGEPWLCGTEGNCVNGWRYDASALYAHTFEGPKLKMVGISASLCGIYDEDDFAEIYKPYNPGFKTYSVSAVSQFSIIEKQSLVVILKASRNRKFEKDIDEYKPEETLVQKYERAQWCFEGVSLIWTVNLL